MNAPRKLNVGSGKDFRADFLNVDISDHWSPDIIADLSKPLPPSDGIACFTTRFGEVHLSDESFDELMANDVLEHVSDLVATMTNCLRLLRVGGVFNIIVPYDLSYGAWQDPTHVRAFNERSWAYYTDWFWYLGWDSHRFIMKNLEFMLNPIGQQLLQQGVPQEGIIRAPRAVDSMKVVLEKVLLSDSDRDTLRTMTGANRRQPE